MSIKVKPNDEIENWFKTIVRDAKIKTKGKSESRRSVDVSEAYRRLLNGQ